MLYYSSISFFFSYILQLIFINRIWFSYCVKYLRMHVKVQPFAPNDFPPTVYIFHNKGVDPSILTVLILVDGEIYSKPGLCQILILDHGVFNVYWSPKHYWKLWNLFLEGDTVDNISLGLAVMLLTIHCCSVSLQSIGHTLICLTAYIHCYNQNCFCAKARLHWSKIYKLGLQRFHATFIVLLDNADVYYDVESSAHVFILVYCLCFMHCTNIHLWISQWNGTRSVTL